MTSAGVCRGEGSSSSISCTTCAGGELVGRFDFFLRVVFTFDWVKAYAWSVGLRAFSLVFNWNGVCQDCDECLVSTSTKNSCLLQRLQDERFKLFSRHMFVGICYQTDTRFFQSHESCVEWGVRYDSGVTIARIFFADFLQAPVVGKWSSIEAKACKECMPRDIVL
jgi:hypothetical protein